MGTPSGPIGLLAGAISYTLGVCALVRPEDVALPTPCADWDLGTLLGHLGHSMADLETALRAGRLDLERPGTPPDPPAGVPAAGALVDVLRDRAAVLLSVSYCYAVPETPEGPGRFVAVGGLPVPAGLVVCTGAVEIAVHGWDVSAALGAAAPIPAALATRMLRLCPLLVAGREGLFALPVEVPAQASPGDRLVGYLGRHPGVILPTELLVSITGE
jgi:uncharacterized protein (TIGR03086 family)